MLYRRWLAVVLGLWVCLSASLTRADTAGTKPEPTGCTSRCFVLDTLQLGGGLRDKSLRFELTGGVLAAHEVDVPLFGPADQIRVESVTIDGAPASVGFEDGTYFVRAKARRFVVRGKLHLDQDLVLTIPGPLNTFQARLTSGRVVEGEQLSGIRATALHFDRQQSDHGAATPTVFQLARAIRVGQSIQFEYRLDLRSGADLGVVRLPLAFDENVLDVAGSPGWRVEGKEVFLPTSGRSASITVTGTMAAVRTFRPDERSSFEWWLVEADAKHRLLVDTDAKRGDPSQGPIPIKQASARLYLLERGQRLAVQVKPLANSEVLAAALRSQHRQAYLSEKGDVIFEDSFAYENNGVDYLPYRTTGRPVFLASDRNPEQIVHAEGDPGQILIPLKTGSHSALLQQQARMDLSMWAGVVRVPLGEHPLASGVTSVGLALPDFIVPLVAYGGDDLFTACGWRDLVAGLLAALAALFTRPGRRRLLAFVVLWGLWWMSHPLFVWALVLLLLGTCLRAVIALLSGWRRVALAGAIGLMGLATLPLVVRALLPSYAYGAVGGELGMSAPADKAEKNGLVQGVKPVALSTPRYGTEVRVNREFAPSDRRFEPVMVFCTQRVLWCLRVAWAALALLWFSLYRAEARNGWARLRAGVAAWDLRCSRR